MIIEIDRGQMASAHVLRVYFKLRVEIARIWWKIDNCITSLSLSLAMFKFIFFFLIFNPTREQLIPIIITEHSFQTHFIYIFAADTIFFAAACFSLSLLFSFSLFFRYIHVSSALVWESSKLCEREKFFFFIHKRCWGRRSLVSR